MCSKRCEKSPENESENVAIVRLIAVIEPRPQRGRPGYDEEKKEACQKLLVRIVVVTSGNYRDAS